MLPNHRYGRRLLAAVLAVTSIPLSTSSQACVQGPSGTAGIHSQPHWWYVCCIGGCSGSLVRGPRVVLTAAHCIGSDAGTKYFWRSLINESYLGVAQGSYAVVMSGYSGSNNDMGYNVTRTGLSSGDTQWYADDWTAYQSQYWHEHQGYPAEQGWNGRTPGWVGINGANRYTNTPGSPHFFTTNFFMLGGMSGGPVIEKWGNGSNQYKQIGINNWSDRCNNAGSRRIDGLAVSLLNGAPTN